MADILLVPGAWGRRLVDTASAHRIEGLPIAGLPDLVVLKLLAGRTIDAGDIARMLGHQDQVVLTAVRRAVRAVLTDEDVADVDKLIALGQAEYGTGPPTASERWLEGKLD